MSVSLFDIVIVAGIILILWAILSLATASTTQDKSYPPLERNEVQFTTQTTTQPEPTSLSGTCYVIDGDTIVIGKQKIRFAGMNAPELNEPYGKQAKWALILTGQVALQAKTQLVSASFQLQAQPRW